MRVAVIWISGGRQRWYGTRDGLLVLGVRPRLAVCCVVLSTCAPFDYCFWFETENWRCELPLCSRSSKLFLRIRTTYPKSLQWAHQAKNIQWQVGRVLITYPESQVVGLTPLTICLSFSRRRERRILQSKVWRRWAGMGTWRSGWATG